jgi:phosphoserine phosphatase
MLVRLQRLLGIGPEETVAVGDGANDRDEGAS